MNAKTAQATAEAEIRELVGRWLKAVVATDIDGIVSHYAPDIVAFDAVSQLQFTGMSRTRIGRMHDMMARHVERGDLPGLVTPVSRRGAVHVDASGAVVAAANEVPPAQAVAVAAIAS